MSNKVAEELRRMVDSYQPAGALRMLVLNSITEIERLESIISGKTFPLEDPRVSELQAENVKLRELSIQAIPYFENDATFAPTLTKRSAAKRWLEQAKGVQEA